MIPAEKLKEQVTTLLEDRKHDSHDYFTIIKEIALLKDSDGSWQDDLNKLYTQVEDEILSNTGMPVNRVKFGTSGWRGILGKDLFCKSVAQVTLAIVEMYKNLQPGSSLSEVLGVADLTEAQSRGCVIGFDNRFGGDILGRIVVEVLDREGFKVFYAGESTTGVLSAAVLQLNAAFSINLTPSHNPLEYGGLKYNAADAGPAALEATQYITEKSNEIIFDGRLPDFFEYVTLPLKEINANVECIDSYALWQRHVEENADSHGMNFKDIISGFERHGDLKVIVDSVHGASRLHIRRMLNDTKSPRFLHLRDTVDVTFGGVAPEPSSVNMQDVISALQQSNEKLKLGAIIDPDGDRIRFTDGTTEISMNQFGAMAYHFLHQLKKKKGMVAKTVATSNLANNIALQLGEEVFEPRVGFKEFKPVIGKALVCFEESDGISTIGHTPEKDAYIGLILALDMILTTEKNLSDYLNEIESEFGYYYPDRDGITVAVQGRDLLDALAGLEKYKEGVSVTIGDTKKSIVEVIAIDGRKMIFDDGSWLMIRPSGTEPKVRFYVESRTQDGTRHLVAAAQQMLTEVGLL